MIVLDMDGVLVNFCDAAYRVCGRRHEYVGDVPTQRDFWKDWGLSGNEFWARVAAAGPGFWVNMPKYPWADELIELARSCGDVYVATQPPPNKLAWSSACSGKRQAIASLFGRNLAGFSITDSKHLLGHVPGAVLIDDFEDNCERFRECGGAAVLFPQPWNRARRDVDRRMTLVRSALKHMTRRGHDNTAAA